MRCAAMPAQPVSAMRRRPMYIGDRAARWDTGMILLWNSDNGSRYIAAGQVWNPRYDRDGRAAVHRRVRCRLTRGVLRYSEGAGRGGGGRRRGRGAAARD